MRRWRLDGRIVVNGEGLEPNFGGRWFDVTEAVGELSGTSFYFSKDTFDGVPISVGDMSKSEAESALRGMKLRASVDEERVIVYLIFLSQFVEKHPRCDGSPLENSWA